MRRSKGGMTKRNLVDDLSCEADRDDMTLMTTGDDAPRRPQRVAPVRSPSIASRSPSIASRSHHSTPSTAQAKPKQPNSGSSGGRCAPTRMPSPSKARPNSKALQQPMKKPGFMSPGVKGCKKQQVKAPSAEFRDQGERAALTREMMTRSKAAAAAAVTAIGATAKGTQEPKNNSEVDEHDKGAVVTAAAVATTAAASQSPAAEEQEKPTRKTNSSAAKKGAKGTDPSPAQKSTNATDPSPAQKITSDADPSPAQKITNDPDPSPVQKSTKDADPTPQENDTNDTGPSPAEKSTRDNDPFPAEKSTRVSDPSPAEQSTKVSDPSPAEKSTRDNDPSPAEKSTTKAKHEMAMDAVELAKLAMMEAEDAESSEDDDDEEEEESDEEDQTTRPADSLDEGGDGDFNQQTEADKMTGEDSPHSSNAGVDSAHDNNLHESELATAAVDSHDRQSQPYDDTDANHSHRNNSNSFKDTSTATAEDHQHDDGEPLPQDHMLGDDHAAAKDSESPSKDVLTGDEQPGSQRSEFTLSQLNIASIGKDNDNTMRHTGVSPFGGMSSHFNSRWQSPHTLSLHAQQGEGLPTLTRSDLKNLSAPNDFAQPEDSFEPPTPRAIFLESDSNHNSERPQALTASFDVSQADQDEEGQVHQESFSSGMQYDNSASERMDEHNCDGNNLEEETFFTTDGTKDIDAQQLEGRTSKSFGDAAADRRNEMPEQKKATAPPDKENEKPLQNPLPGTNNASPKKSKIRLLRDAVRMVMSPPRLSETEATDVAQEQSPKVPSTSDKKESIDPFVGSMPSAQSSKREKDSFVAEASTNCDASFHTAHTSCSKKPQQTANSDDRKTKSSTNSVTSSGKWKKGRRKDPDEATGTFVSPPESSLNAVASFTVVSEPPKHKESHKEEDDIVVDTVPAHPVKSQRAKRPVSMISHSPSSFDDASSVAEEGTMTSLGASKGKCIASTQTTSPKLPHYENAESSKGKYSKECEGGAERNDPESGIFEPRNFVEALPMSQVFFPEPSAHLVSQSAKFLGLQSDDELDETAILEGVRNFTTFPRDPSANQDGGDLRKQQSQSEEAPAQLDPLYELFLREGWNDSHVKLLKLQDIQAATARQPGPFFVNDCIRQACDLNVFSKDEWSFEFSAPEYIVGRPKASWSVNATKDLKNENGNHTMVLTYRLKTLNVPHAYIFAQEQTQKMVMTVRDSATQVLKRMDDQAWSALAILYSLAFEHARACDANYCLLEVHPSISGFLQESFRMKQVRSDFRSPASKGKERLLCDLSNCSLTDVLLKRHPLCQIRCLVKIPMDKSTITPMSGSGENFVGLRVEPTATSGIEIRRLDKNGAGKRVKKVNLLPFRCWKVNHVKDEIEKLAEEKEDELKKIEEELGRKVSYLMDCVRKECQQHENPENARRRNENKRAIEEFEEKLSRSHRANSYNQVEDDMEALCDICNDGEVTPQNRIVFCDGCEIAVHQHCYGIPEVPFHQYHCQPCSENVPNEKYKPSELVCELCPRPGGVFVKVQPSSGMLLPQWPTPRNQKSRWAHAICAWAQNLSHPTTRDLSDLFDRFGKEGVRCCLCCDNRGTFTKCASEECSNYMHVTCARDSKLCAYGMQLEITERDEGCTATQFEVYCEEHSKKVGPPPEDAVPVEDLARHAKYGFPFRPFPQLSSEQQREALEDPEYETLFIEYLEREPYATKCNVCDADYGKALHRCCVCKAGICDICMEATENEYRRSGEILCGGCRHTREKKSCDAPQCSVCYQKGGWLRKAIANYTEYPKTRMYFEKGGGKLSNTLFGKELFCHTICSRYVVAFRV